MRPRAEFDWREEDSIADTFPPLRLLGGLSLASESLRSVATQHSEKLALRWIRTCSPRAVETIGDLLSVTWSKVLEWRQVGPQRRDLILAFLGKVSTEAATLVTDLSIGPTVLGPEEDYLRYPIDELHLGDELYGVPVTAAQEWEDAIQTLGAWAATVAGGSTWADVIGLADLQRPQDIEEAWRLFAGYQVPLGGQAPASEVIEHYLKQSLSERERTVLLDRIVGPSRRTLDELGTELGVSRERVRQIETRVEAKVLQAYAESPEWRSVRWATDALRSRLGSMAPTQLRQSALPGMRMDEQRITTWLAGYRLQGDFLLAKGFVPPTVRTLPRLAHEGRVIDEFETIEAMMTSGVKHELVDEVIASIDGQSRIDGQLVDWTGSQVDRAISVLEARDEPQDLQSLFELAGGDSFTSFRNRIFESSRIIRVTKGKVGLRSWGGTHYTSITDLMAQRLTSGPMAIDELANELERTYEVSANSVTMYAYAPAFKVTGGTVALRAHHDPYVARDKPQAVHGLFRIGPDTLVWHIDVDADVLRGSGRALPQEIGTFLGIAPGGSALVLRNPYDDLSVNWPETSITGPNIGSLRLHALALRAGEGETLRIAFTKGSSEVAVTMVAPHSDSESPAESLSRLTGLPVNRCGDLQGLAEAIGVSDGQVVETLIKRKDAETSIAAEMVWLSGSID